MPKFKKTIFTLSIFLLVSYPFLFAEETLTITTYYPSPYGSYNELTTTGKTCLATTSGNVGIGTTAPETRLHIFGDLPTLRIEENDSNSQEATLDFKTPAGRTARLVSRYTNPAATTETYLAFHTNVLGSANDTVAEAMRIVGGNVGIGTTGPQYKLDVGPVSASQSATAGAAGLIRNSAGADSSPFTQARIIVYGGAGVDTGNWGYLGYGSDAYMRIVYGKTGSGSNPKLIIGTSSATDGSGTFTSNVAVDTNGNVGIGTTGPGAKLDINGGVIIARDISSFGDTDGNGSYGFYDAGGTKRKALFYNGVDIYFGNPTNNDIYIRTNNTDRVFIDNAGNVGIGTTNPNQLLVVGSARKTYCNGTTWGTDGSDYAEYFENEEILPIGTVAGLNPQSGKVRRYRPGDEFVGLVSGASGFIGNDSSGERAEDAKYTLVGLLGQLDFDKNDVVVENRVVYTRDRKKIGILLANGKVLVR